MQVKDNMATEALLPNLEKPCQASVRINIVVQEPLNNGQWGIKSCTNDSFNFVLNSHDDLTINQALLELIQIWKQQIDQKHQVVTLGN